MSKREDTIQSLLRHSFVCLENSNCTCAKNIKDFLSTDEISLNWVKGIFIKKSNEMECGR